jgi:hypothetical protein
LIETLTDLPDDAEILVEAWPHLAALPLNGELYAIQADLVPAEGCSPAFLTLKPEIASKPGPTSEDDRPAELASHSRSLPAR